MQKNQKKQNQCSTQQLQEILDEGPHMLCYPVKHQASVYSILRSLLNCFETEHTKCNRNVSWFKF